MKRACREQSAEATQKGKFVYKTFYYFLWKVCVRCQHHVGFVKGFASGVKNLHGSTLRMGRSAENKVGNAKKIKMKK